jgi:hypothetical protein
MSAHADHSEEEKPLTADCISLSQEFSLFPPQRTETYYFTNEIAQIYADVCLATDFLEPLPITIFAEFDNTLPRLEVLTPYQPERGYPLDQQDFLDASRRAKIETLQESLLEPVEGLALMVGYADDSPDNIFRKALSPQSYRFLDRLHLVLTFPNGSSFVSKAYYDPRSLSLTFEKFFPADTGPLPALGPVKTRQRFWKIEEGLRILLPADLESLQWIKGKFEYLSE